MSRACSSKKTANVRVAVPAGAACGGRRRRIILALPDDGVHTVAHFTINTGGPRAWYLTTTSLGYIYALCTAVFAVGLLMTGSPRRRPRDKAGRD